MPSISVIVPTLNEEKQIVYLLKSLEDQTFKDFELIVVDGGSNDQTIEKINACSIKNKIAILEGAGEYYSRDFAVANLAQAPILLFVNADTILPKELMEKVYIKFQKNRRLIALGGPHILYNGSVLSKIEYFVFNVFRYLTAKLRYAFHCGGSLFATRKEYFEKVGGYGIETMDADGLPATKIADCFGFSRVEFSLETCVFLSARRFKEMGFMSANKHYFSWCWGILLPHFIRWHPKVSSFIRRSSRKMRRRHLELHRATKR